MLRPLGFAGFGALVALGALTSAALDVERYNAHIAAGVPPPILPSIDDVRREGWRRASEARIASHARRWGQLALDRRDLDLEWGGLLNSQAEWWAEVGRLSARDRKLEAYASVTDIIGGVLINAGTSMAIAKLSGPAAGKSGEGGSAAPSVEKTTVAGTIVREIPCADGVIDETVCFTDDRLIEVCKTPSQGCVGGPVSELIRYEFSKVTERVVNAPDSASPGALAKVLKHVDTDRVLDATFETLALLGGADDVQCVESVEQCWAAEPLDDAAAGAGSGTAGAGAQGDGTAMLRPQTPEEAAADAKAREEALRESDFIEPFTLDLDLLGGSGLVRIGWKGATAAVRKGAKWVPALSGRLSVMRRLNMRHGHLGRAIVRYLGTTANSTAPVRKKALTTVPAHLRKFSESVRKWAGDRSLADGFWLAGGKVPRVQSCTATPP